MRTALSLLLLSALPLATPHAEAALPSVVKPGSLSPHLREATDLMRGSKMLRAAFGDEIIDHYVHNAEWEQFEYDRRITDWELKRGFERS